MTVTSKKHPLKAFEANGWYVTSASSLSSTLIFYFREIWSPSQRPDKVYWRSTTPGSRITFEFNTTGGLGQVSLTYLKSKTFGMGSVWVWKHTPGEIRGGSDEIQTADNMRPWGIRINGWWDVDGM
jgi:hypothetical protein